MQKNQYPIWTCLLTASDVAQRLSMANSGVYALLARGELAHFRIGRLVRIREEDLDAYLFGRRIAPVSRTITPYACHPKT